MRSGTTATLAALIGSIWATTALAWTDADGDFVRGYEDNCLLHANGPNELAPQRDADFDGYGDACDPDYDNDGFTTTSDFLIFLDSFEMIAPTLLTDHSGNGATTTEDFLVFLEFFVNGNAPPGPSGLACAGTVPCPPIWVPDDL